MPRPAARRSKSTYAQINDFFEPHGQPKLIFLYQVPDTVTDCAWCFEQARVVTCPRERERLFPCTRACASST